MAFFFRLSLMTKSFAESIQNQFTFVNYIVSVEHIKQYMHIPSEDPAVIEYYRPPDNGEIRGKMEYLAQTAPYHQEIILCTSSKWRTR